MPFITVKVLEGKTTEQKRQLIERMTQVACETLDVDPSNAFIFIEDLEKSNYGKNGKLFPISKTSKRLNIYHIE